MGFKKTIHNWGAPFCTLQHNFIPFYRGGAYCERQKNAFFLQILNKVKPDMNSVSWMVDRCILQSPVSCIAVDSGADLHPVVLSACGGPAASGYRRLWLHHHGCSQQA